MTSPFGCAWNRYLTNCWFCRLLGQLSSLFSTTAHRCTAPQQRHGIGMKQSKRTQAGAWLEGQPCCFHAHPVQSTPHTVSAAVYALFCAWWPSSASCVWSNVPRQSCKSGHVEARPTTPFNCKCICDADRGTAPGMGRCCAAAAAAAAAAADLLLMQQQQQQRAAKQLSHCIALLTPPEATTPLSIGDHDSCSAPPQHITTSGWGGAGFQVIL